MLPKNLYWLSKIAIVMAVLAFSVYGCKKQDKGQITSPQKPIDFFFDLQYQMDTVLVFSDTESYRIYFENTLGEGRCADWLTSNDCNDCVPYPNYPMLPGYTGAVIKIYNQMNDSVRLQPRVNGCRLEEADSAIVLSNLQNINPTFYFEIGLKKMIPYPASYTNGSINFEDYVATFRIVKP